MRTSGNLFLIMLAAVLMIGAVSFIQDSDAAVPDADTPTVAEKTVEVFSEFDMGFLDEPSYIHINGITEIGPDTVWNTTSVMEDGSILRFSEGAVLTLSDGADLYIAGTVTFESDCSGPFSIGLGPGSSLNLGGHALFRNTGGTAVISSTGEFVLSCTYENDEKDAVPGVPDMSFTSKMYIDALSPDSNGTSSLVFTTSVPDGDGAVRSIHSVSQTFGQEPEITVSVIADADGFYKQVSEEHPDAEWNDLGWWETFLTDPGSEVPVLSMEISVNTLAGNKSVISGTEERMTEMLRVTGLNAGAYCGGRTSA